MLSFRVSDFARKSANIPLLGKVFIEHFDRNYSFATQLNKTLIKPAGNYSATFIAQPIAGLTKLIAKRKHRSTIDLNVHNQETNIHKAITNTKPTALVSN